MSTDDLTKALRIAGQCRGFADPSRSERAIIALADEVDRLREARDDWRRHFEATRDNRDLWRTHAEETLAERDAARAALERVRGVLDDYLGDHVTNAHSLVLHVTRALEGEPS